jgi:glycosyltransferase involved in cell wall biosynthesis
MSKPFITVVVPALNEEKYLPLLLESLTHQTLNNFEVIVVDGSSADKTVAKTKMFLKKVPGLSVIVSPVASLPLQRNLGAKKGTGEWLAFIDADSILMPYFFERVTEYIETYKPELMTTWFRPDTEVNSDALITLFGNITLEGSIMLKKQLAPGPLTLISRKAYDMVGGYDEDHAFNEDLDLSMRLHRLGIKLNILKETLYVWSMRRIRHQGTFKVLQQYAKGAMPVLFFNKTLKRMPGYVMGGQLYDKKLPKQTVFKSYEEKLKKLLKELFI